MRSHCIAGPTSLTFALNPSPSRPPACPACATLDADSSGNIQLLVSLQQLLAECGDQPWGYAWLPQPAIAALGNLLHASLLRRWAGRCLEWCLERRMLGGCAAALQHRAMDPGMALLLPCPSCCPHASHAALRRSLGKAAPVAAYLAAAQEAVEQQLAALSIDLEVGAAAAADAADARSVLLVPLLMTMPRGRCSAVHAPLRCSCAALAAAVRSGIARCSWAGAARGANLRPAPQPASPAPAAAPGARPPQGSEAQLGVRAIWEGRTYCHLRVMLAEQQAVVALTSSRFAQASRAARALPSAAGDGAGGGAARRAAEAAPALWSLPPLPDGSERCVCALPPAGRGAAGGADLPAGPLPLAAARLCALCPNAAGCAPGAAGPAGVGWRGAAPLVWHAPAAAGQQRCRAPWPSGLPPAAASLPPPRPPSPSHAPRASCDAGHYAHSMQQYPAASAHFQSALLAEAPHLHDAAALAAAAAELHADAGPGGVRRALELLEGRGLTGLPHVLSLPVHDRWASPDAPPPAAMHLLLLECSTRLLSQESTALTPPRRCDFSPSPRSPWNATPGRSRCLTWRWLRSGRATRAPRAST